jgi:RNA polymerase sigma-70 factor (ECF subfamily)
VGVATSEEFVRQAEGFRRELLAHCYRMLGSVDDAEDLVQEVLLRAWRSHEKFEGRSSVRTWLYRIATNACLSALQHRDRRYLPSGLGAPGNDPHGTIELAGPEVRWVQPIPDALVDPAEIVAGRNHLRLALIVSLQHLPPQQRAVLLLREVLAFPAAEVAEILDLSVPAVKSSLQRARAKLDELEPDGEQITEPSDARAQALLDQYIAAFENSDAAALEKLLRDDTVLEFTPSRTWFSGLRT